MTDEKVAQTIAKRELTLSEFIFTNNEEASGAQTTPCSDDATSTTPIHEVPNLHFNPSTQKPAESNHFYLSRGSTRHQQKLFQTFLQADLV